MKLNKLLITSILILSAAIIFGSVWIGNAIKSTNKESDSKVGNEAQELESQVVSFNISDKALLTEQEVAQYLGIPQDKLNIILQKEKIERQKLSSYDTYRYMPYIEIDDEKYFLKNEVDEWLQYHSSNRSKFDT
ncbi:hypothetical protein [Vallitalea guaymasensis]|uniref:hypothetical protein n=1 Tax=Vallitalea guaymasensis TaxID=1185412 RepID=UPI00235374E6|nr:hypothetical protein [Vallitalea guaymasensis]